MPKPKPKLKRIYASPGNLKRNEATGHSLPCCVVEMEGKKYYGTSVTIDGPSRVVSNMEASPRVWVETEADVGLHFMEEKVL